MRKLLLITGDLATGKSTFSNILSQRYKVNVFCKDSIKEVLGDTIGFKNREENKKLFNASMKLMFFIFSEFAELGKDLILESNFHTEELEGLHEIARNNNYEVLTISLYGNVKILHERYMNRINENRHPAHLSATLDVFEDFKRCSDYLTNVEKPGEVIRVNADDFAYQSNPDLLTELDQFMEENNNEF